MYKNQFKLLTTQRFLPLFITQFLSAFNDNLYKSALVVLITYVLAGKFNLQSEILVSLTGALFILPMFLFSAQAGTIGDKFEKGKTIKWIKLSEVIIMVWACLALFTQSLTMLLGILFLLGMQTAFFGPIKYSILPQLLAKDELVSGTALVESGTFLAILFGNIMGAYLITLKAGVGIVAAVVVSLAIIGYLSSFYIPKTAASAPNLKINANFIQETLNVVRFSQRDKNIFLCILGISWFWLMGFVFLSLFPDYTKDYIAANYQVFVLFLSLFSVGIGVGSSLCNRLLKGNIEATYVPLAAFGMTIFALDLYYATPKGAPGGALLSLSEFLQDFKHWRIMTDIFFIALCGGVFVVPLYAILQDQAQDAHKARIIASNNIMNALFMAGGALLTMGLLKLNVLTFGWLKNFTIPAIMMFVALMNIIVGIQACRLLPGALVKSILRTVLTLLFKVEVKGIHHFMQAGDRVVITPNHTSFLDGLLLGAFFPGKLAFAINAAYLDKWWIKPLHLVVELYGLEPTNPYVIKTLVNKVKENKKLVIFPEGRITLTGSLMKVYEGPGLVAHKTDAKILPVLIDGAQYSLFSKLHGKVRLKWFPKITITVFESRNIHVDPHLSSRQRRQLIREELYQIMSNIFFLSQHNDTSLFQALLDAKSIHGANYAIVEDIQRKPLTYKKLILGSLLIGKKLAKFNKKGEAVGILLPNSLGAVVSFFGLQAYQRIAALLNFSAGIQNVIKACETAEIKSICTARLFVEKANLQSLITALQEKEIRILYLEDLKKELYFFNKLAAVMKSWFPSLFGFTSKPEQAQQPAVVLFTSGSEGTPKGVVLSSGNIQANKSQVLSRVDFRSTDVVLNALPMFHSFGLTVGTIAPILNGSKLFLYPSPLHYRMIPEFSYDVNATILFGTNTFLAGYARYANPYDFYSIRYVFAGAEKLKEEVRQLWADKFGLRIFEGYGTTEASPVVSVNTPMHHRLNSVGRLMPGMSYRIELVPGVLEGGRLFIKGPNIMLGYLYHENPNTIVAPPEGWYDTGDIVTLDQDGFIFIQGRAKRFAKIGGEMISLTFVENYLDKLWPHAMHAVVARPDERKGEQLILVTTQQDAQRNAIIEYTRSHGISELAVPRAIKVLNKLPVLGSGKIDYVMLNEWLKADMSLAS